jgi:HlyD family secretion protein
VRAINAMLLITALGIAGCDVTEPSLPSVEVKRSDLELVVRARGEIVASESIPITLPGNVRMAFNIAWLIPEYSEVKKGQVIARFDDDEIRADRIDSELGVVKSELELENFRRSAELDRSRIGDEADRVDGERDITMAFVDVDPRLFSRNEIIDALSDVDYLDVAGAYYEWQATTHEQRTQAEEEAILSGQQSFASKLAKQDAALQMIELRSPADGTFVYARTSWGQKVAKGQRVFAGRPVGLLPVRGKVRARLYVAESDAVGLAEGQSVTLRLDSAVERDFTATVSSVSPVASPRGREDPRKFFTVEAELDTVDASLMRVGSNLEAEIVTHDMRDAILLPEQTVYYEGDQAFVTVVSGNSSEQRPVALGRRSPNLLEIVDGLAPGEQVSLVGTDGGRS